MPRRNKVDSACRQLPWFLYAGTRAQINRKHTARLHPFVEQTLDIDGTEVVTLCLRKTLATTKYRYLRLALEETE